MNVTRTSMATGKEHTLDLPVTQDQLDEMAKPPNQRRLIQDIFPQLNSEQREFIKTGITAKEWAAIFPPKKE
jgi:hypothetical protein